VDDRVLALHSSRLNAEALAIRFAAYDPEGELERRPLIVNEREIAAIRRELEGAPRIRALLKRLIEE